MTISRTEVATLNQNLSVDLRFVAFSIFQIFKGFFYDTTDIRLLLRLSACHCQQGGIQEFVQGGLTFFFLSLKSIDFTGPGGS